MKYQESMVTGKWAEMVKEDQPCERAYSVGINALSDMELIGLILGSCGQTYSLEETSGKILELLDQNKSTLSDLTSIPGIGKSKSLALCAALELGRRRTAQRCRRITSPTDVFPYIQAYGLRKQEHFIVIALNGAHEVIDLNVVTIGLVNRTLVHPREVFSPALMERACAIIIAHNHPSENLEPSPEDLIVTRELKHAGEILGIKVLDHLIFCFTSFHSLMENGEL